MYAFYQEPNLNWNLWMLLIFFHIFSYNQSLQSVLAVLECRKVEYVLFPVLRTWVCLNILNSYTNSNFQYTHIMYFIIPPNALLWCRWEFLRWCNSKLFIRNPILTSACYKRRLSELVSNIEPLRVCDPLRKAASLSFTAIPFLGIKTNSGKT